MKASIHRTRHGKVTKEPSAGTQPERVESTNQQEHFTGSLPLRNERPAAELLRERQYETDQTGSFAVFIP